MWPKTCEEASMLSAHVSKGARMHPLYTAQNSASRDLHETMWAKKEGTNGDIAKGNRTGINAQSSIKISTFPSIGYLLL